jgi:hypothetical protein
MTQLKVSLKAEVGHVLVQDASLPDGHSWLIWSQLIHSQWPTTWSLVDSSSIMTM